jgi:membrane-associated protease RseP (regulator of RpoE activity)
MEGNSGRITMIDMKLFRAAVLACATATAAAGVLATTSLSAQVYRTQGVPRGWIGISYDETIVIHGNARSGAVTITDVIKDSPAEKAGLQPGDTVVRVNGFRATTDVLGSMGASVEPGDTVHIVVRRGGRDADIAVEVAKRPPQTFVQGRTGARIYTYDPDSVRGMMKLFVDSMYAGLDSTHMRMFRFDTAGGFMQLNGDSMFVGSLPMTVFRNGFPDSTMFHFAPGRMFNDSAFIGLRSGVFADSVFRMLPRMHDTLFRALPRSNVVMPEIFDDMRTPDIVFRSFARGENAFAGADLAEMNPDLGEYFGTKSGVLVLTVPDGTPAARAGLEAGDIVTKVDGTPVGSVLSLRRTVEKVRRGAPIKLEIVRHQKTRTVELKRE